MKRIIISLLLLLVLTACSGENVSESKNEKYLDYCDLLTERATFKSESELFDVTTELTAIENGYRYYIIIDNPKTAMYNIEAVGLVKNSDYTTNMAANIGIFEDNKYSMIPNQVNSEKNFVKGVSISGITNQENPVIYLLVQWTNKDMTITNKEFINLYFTVGGNDGE